MHDFDELRRSYPVFHYDGYDISRTEDGILLSFDFGFDALAQFRPQTRIVTDNLTIVNDFDSPTAHAIVFALGLVEAVSYYKAVCSPVFEVRCGALTAEQKRWWKKLWYHGLGEFFYRNGIQTDEESFVEFRCPETVTPVPCDFHGSGLHIVPIGGGKDSAVSLSLLQSERERIFGFTVNDQPARTDTLRAAGLADTQCIRTYRTIDPELLRLNREGFLNGHTPFSAIVAFLSLYCAYLIGAEDIILSNESSANESNICGTDINHQYSKSFAFEQDFSNYIQYTLNMPVRYFSLLRPFNELQIAKQFAALPQYHGIFKSCNVGSKRNIWCCACAKCLFVYCILSPFLSEEKLVAIFGENLLDKESLSEDFRGLCGLSPVKPFECIGTVREVRAALCRTIAQYKADGKPLPYLLTLCDGKFTADNPLDDLNAEHNIPPEFQGFMKEMADFVRTD